MGGILGLLRCLVWLSLGATVLGVMCIVCGISRCCCCCYITFNAPSIWGSFGRLICHDVRLSER